MDHEGRAPLATRRLLLRPVSTVGAERIVAGLPVAGDSWSVGFPCVDAVSLAAMFLLRAALNESEPPYGLYLIERRTDRTVVGGIDFKGKPRAGGVEIGYALAPSSRGHGFAAEATSALVDLARSRGVARVVATTTDTNLASRLTLERAGFTCVDTGREQNAERYYVLQLP